MNFGIPAETWELEHRVGLTPAGVLSLTRRGHNVYVQHDAGKGAHFRDRNYQDVGAQIVYSAEEVFGRADVVLKVSRLIEQEYELLQPGQTLLSYLHLAVAPPALSETFSKREITAIAYELIQTPDGQLPVLNASSQVAGRLAPIIAGQLLETTQGGRGILLDGMPGVPPAAIAILGAGVLGRNAALAFYGAGAQVTILDSNLEKLEILERESGGRITTLISNSYNLTRVIKFADVLIGAILVPGERTPILITQDLISQMRPRAVFIDFSIDQGGCSETSRPTSHSSPTYILQGVIHYAVPNIPARVARTASYALTNSALNYLKIIAEGGVDGALAASSDLRKGLVFSQGERQNR
ncbi:MAG: alanine dehydrogenase [Anaerolineales bacterium]|nr:alanine dehydrogenase [Anaerolineales bacterium]